MEVGGSGHNFHAFRGKAGLVCDMIGMNYRKVWLLFDVYCKDLATKTHGAIRVER